MYEEFIRWLVKQDEIFMLKFPLIMIIALVVSIKSLVKG